MEMTCTELAEKMGLPSEGECSCGEIGSRVFPNVEIETAVKMSYITCVGCFRATWAGEN